MQTPKSTAVPILEPETQPEMQPEPPADEVASITFEYVSCSRMIILGMNHNQLPAQLRVSVAHVISQEGDLFA
jgi:hypothetical protein